MRTLSEDTHAARVAELCSARPRPLTAPPGRLRPEEVARAVELLAGCQGKVILTGVGKSGFIARKIGATLTSTGTRAVFLHPSGRAARRPSHSPELWVELLVDEGALDPETVSTLSLGTSGSEMLQYFKKTEKRYSMGLCQGQLLERLNAGRNTMSRASPGYTGKAH